MPPRSVPATVVAPGRLVASAPAAPHAPWYRATPHDLRCPASAGQSCPPSNQLPWTDAQLTANSSACRPRGGCSACLGVVIFASTAWAGFSLIVAIAYLCRLLRRLRRSAARTGAAPRSRCRDGELRAGRHAAARAGRRVAALDEAQTRALRGPRADPAAFMLIRPFLKLAVYIEIAGDDQEPALLADRHQAARRSSPRRSSDRDRRPAPAEPPWDDLQTGFRKDRGWQIRRRGRRASGCSRASALVVAAWRRKVDRVRLEARSPARSRPSTRRTRRWRSARRSPGASWWASALRRRGCSRPAPRSGRPRRNASRRPCRESPWPQPGRQLMTRSESGRRQDSASARPIGRRGA